MFGAEEPRPQGHETFCTGKSSAEGRLEKENFLLYRKDYGPCWEKNILQEKKKKKGPIPSRRNSDPPTRSCEKGEGVFSNLEKQQDESKDI